MTRRRLAQLLTWLFALVLVVWVITSVSWAETWAALRRIEARQLLVLAVANVLVLVAMTGRWWLLLRGLGFRLPFARLFGFRLAAFGLSYVTPGPHIGGEPLQVVLVEREGATRTTALAAVALDKSLEFSVNFSFILAGLLAVVRLRLIPEDATLQVLGLTALLLMLPLAYLLATAKGHSPVGRLLTVVARTRPIMASERRRQRAEGIAGAAAEAEARIAAMFHSAPWHLLAALAVSLLAWLLMLVEYWLMVAFLGARLDLTQLVITLTAARMSTLLLVPAGLGAQEAGLALGFRLAGLSPALGLAVSLLIRARDTLLAAIGLLWGAGKLRVAAAPDDKRP